MYRATFIRGKFHFLIIGAGIGEGRGMLTEIRSRSVGREGTGMGEPGICQGPGEDAFFYSPQLRECHHEAE
jgi:hypothetical protein